MGNILSLNKNGNKFWVLAFGFIVLFIPTFLIVWKVMQNTHGVFMYPYDDTFIHLTIAENLLKGNWGIGHETKGHCNYKPYIHHYSNPDS